MPRYCLTLDLKDDAKLIAEYEAWHQKVWLEIIQSIRQSGIVNMQIYRFSNRMFMIMDVNDDFSFEKKAAADENNLRVEEWEDLMWNYQQPVPGTKPGEKWVLMNRIFEL